MNIDRDRLATAINFLTRQQEVPIEARNERVNINLTLFMQLMGVNPQRIHQRLIEFSRMRSIRAVYTNIPDSNTEEYLSWRRDFSGTLSRQMVILFGGDIGEWEEKLSGHYSQRDNVEDLMLAIMNGRSYVYPVAWDYETAYPIDIRIRIHQVTDWLQNKGNPFPNYAVNSEGHVVEYPGEPIAGFVGTSGDYVDVTSIPGVILDQDNRPFFRVRDEAVYLDIEV